MQKVRVMPLAVFLIISFLGASLSAAESWVVRGRFLDNDGNPATNYAVRASSVVEGKAVVFATRTDQDGAYSFNLTKEIPWKIEIDPNQLISRGFFCAPFVWICENPEECQNSGGINPLPILVISPGDLIFIEPIRLAPLAPTLGTPQRSVDGITFRMTFDSTLDALESVRVYRTESSTDLQYWSPVSTNRLVSSPVIVVDRSAPSSIPRFYRSVLIDTETLTRPQP